MVKSFCLNFVLGSEHTSAHVKEEGGKKKGKQIIINTTNPQM